MNSTRSRSICIWAVLLMNVCNTSGAQINIPQVAFFTDSGAERIVEDIGGTFSVEVGIMSGYTAESFVTSVNQTLASANWYWINMSSFTMTATQTGVATFTVSPWQEEGDFTFVLYDSSGTSCVPVRQMGHTDYWIENTGQRNVYHEQKDSIILNDSVHGLTYTIMCDGLVASDTTGTGGRMVIPVTGPGVFTVSCTSGRVRGSRTLELHSFLKKAQISPDYNPISLPPGSYSNVVFLYTVTGETIDRDAFEEMLAAYNSGLVTYWDERVRLSVYSWSESLIILQFDCGPNTDSADDLLDTRIIVAGGSLTFTQQGGGTLECYEINGESDINATTGTVHLQDSELGVEYLLKDNSGYPYASMKGTGDTLSFRNVSCGKFRITAYTPHASRDMNGEAVIITRPKGTDGANSIRKVTYTESSGKTGMTDIVYHDGLGEVVQTIEVHASGETIHATGLGRDVAYPIYLDQVRRNDTKTFVPFAPQQHSGNYITDAFAQQASFYLQQHGDSTAYAILEREKSPEGRPVSRTRPGKEYRDDDARATRWTYASNSDRDSVARWKAETTDKIVRLGTYPEGKLAKTTCTDEDGRAVTEFRDAKQKLIAERRKLTDGKNADTYYVYDDRDSLIWVIPPECAERTAETQTLTAREGEAAKFCHIYTYDARGNVITHYRPGAGMTRFEYDEADRMTAMQDQVMADQGKWVTWEYDAFGRTEACNLATETPEGISAEKTLARTFHDEYPENAAPFLAETGYSTSYDTRTKGMKTCETVAVEEGTGYRTTTFYYDARGNLIQTVATDDSGTLRTTRTYSFTGKPLKEKETYVPTGSTEGDVVERRFRYDIRDRMVSETVKVNEAEEATVEYTYDALGRRNGNAVMAEDTEVTATVTHDMQGRERERTVRRGSAQIFRSELRYHDTTLAGTVPQYAGNISEWEWSREDTEVAKTYAFLYDGLDRLTGSSLYEEGIRTDAFAEKDIAYDLNGNITSLTRTEGEAQETYTAAYSGNQKTGNTYDGNGNLTYDADAALAMEFNRIGRIRKVSRNDTVLVNYSYLADGTKVSALDDEGNGLLYLGSLIYRKTGNGIELESVGFAAGRLTAKDDGQGGWTLDPMIHVTDHLGSVRAVVDGSTGQVTETNDYYAFGGRWDKSGSLVDQSNRYRYNGKEDQATFGTPYSDYGARQYSSASGRWLAVDPLAEKYYGISPYAFCNNNPVNYIDPDGESWGKASKVVRKIYKTAKAGKKISVKGILKSELVDIADNAHTIFDSDASLFEKGIAAFDLATGFGDEAKWLAKTVGVSDAIVDGAKATDAVKNRVKLRKSTRTTIIEQAPKNADGDFIDPNTGMIVPKEGPFDIGHKRGESWKKRKQEHLDRGSTRKEVIEAENDPNLYQVEDPKSNRSRRYD